MSEVTAEASRTLPEGATVGVYRLVRPKLGAMTELRAWMGDVIIKMKTDNITPQNLQWYLDTCIKHIDREREKITVKPGMVVSPVHTIKDFVNNMAFHGMFICDNPLAIDPRDMTPEQAECVVDATGLTIEEPKPKK